MDEASTATIIFKYFSAIYANIVGRGYCMWTTYSGKRSITNMKEEFYLNRKIYYIGSRNDASGTRLV